MGSVWSPDSQKLAVEDTNRNITRIISAAGGETEIRNVEPFTWLPDSQRLLVGVMGGADAGAIAYASTTTAALTRITKPDVAASWTGVELRVLRYGRSSPALRDGRVSGGCRDGPQARGGAPPRGQALDARHPLTKNASTRPFDRDAEPRFDLDVGTMARLRLPTTDLGSRRHLRPQNGDRANSWLRSRADDRRDARHMGRTAFWRGRRVTDGKPEAVKALPLIIPLRPDLWLGKRPQKGEVRPRPSRIA